VSRSVLPLADAPSLRPAARRTAVVRSGLAAAILLALTAAYALAPNGDLANALASGGTGSVVVLDVSGSITDHGSAQIQHTLADEIRTAGPGGRVGLVLFSDVAMEALPPSAPARALQQFRRFFIAVKKHPGASGADATTAVDSSGARMLDYPQSPWGVAFSGGTTISSGLREAREDLGRAGLDGGRVLLLSDLVDAPQDEPALRRELRAYANDPRLELAVRVLSSNLPQQISLYRGILGDRAVQAARVGPPPSLRTARRYPLPLWLIVLSAAAALALAANELLGVPLLWRRPAGATT
jgi:hypothetical protein